MLGLSIFDEFGAFKERHPDGASEKKLFSFLPSLAIRIKLFPASLAFWR